MTFAIDCMKEKTIMKTMTDIRSKRLPHGRAMVNTIAKQARAVDSLTLLSGVNFKNVCKVLAAIEALRVNGVALEEITRFTDIPVDPVDFGKIDDEKHEIRAASTDTLAAYVVRSGKADFLEYILRFNKRFRGS